MGNILSVEALKVDLLTYEGIVHAVRDVRLTIGKGEVHGIVGESGCGKTVMAKSLMRLHDESRVEYSGRILLDDTIDVLKLKKNELRQLRGNRISMVFQDPMTALNPLLTVGEQLSECLIAHKLADKRSAREKSKDLLEKVGVLPAEKRLGQYPFELSGGMLQRVAIAGAIACNPELLIADEPTTALDVTIQAQIFELLKELQKGLNMSILIITHNLGVVAELCNKVSVMYAGEIIETGNVDTVFNSPEHPYTQALIESMPKFGNQKRRLTTIPGSPPPLMGELSGCAFAPRCKYSDESCKSSPALMRLDTGHYARCRHASA